MKKILIGVIIVNILLAIGQLIYYTISRVKDAISEETATIKTAEEIREEQKVIVPNNSTIYVRLYDGKINSNDVYQKIYQFVHITIPEMKERTKEMSTEEIANFYEENKESMINQYAIKEKIDLVKLIQKIKNVDVTNKNYQSCEFNIESCEYYEDRIEINLNIYFQGSPKLVVRLIERKNYDIVPAIYFIPQ